MRQKLLLVAGLLALALLVNHLPFERESSGLTEILYEWGEEQTEMSETVTSAAVAPAEGTLVGEHAVNGSNWSIPNILRHWLGGGA